MQEVQKGGQPDVKWKSNDEKKKLLRQVSFRILSMESATPNPGQETTNETVRQLKAIQKQLSEAFEAAESTAEYFDRDELAMKAYSEEIVNLGNVREMLDGYEKRCNERERVLFSLDHFFTTSQEDTELASRTESMSSDSDGNGLDGGYKGYSTTEFVNAMSTAYEAASRLQDLHSKILTVASFLRRAKEETGCKQTPLAELEQFFQEASESSCASEIRIVGLQSAFQEVVGTLERALKDNQQLKRINKKEEKKLSACLARATGLKSENEQLRENAKKLEEKFEQQQKETETVSLELKTLKTTVDDHKEVQRLFKETKRRCQALETGMNELKSKVEKVQVDYDKKLVDKDKLIQRQLGTINSLKGKEKQGQQLSASDQTAAENDEKYASATISLSFDDGLPVEKSPDCTRKYSRSDLDLSDENRELRTELEKNRRRMKELEDIIREMYYGRRHNYGYLLPELPQPKKALTSARKKSQGTFKRAPSSPKLLDPPSFVEFSRSIPPQKTLHLSGGTAVLRLKPHTRFSPGTSSPAGHAPSSRSRRWSSYASPSVAFLADETSSVMKISSLTPGRIDYLDAQMDKKRRGSLETSPSLPHGRSKLAEGKKNSVLVNGTWNPTTSSC